MGKTIEAGVKQKKKNKSGREVLENVCFVRPGVKTASIGTSPAVMRLITAYFLFLFQKCVYM